MKSPLDYDNKIVKEFEIDDEVVALDLTYKIAYVRSQLEEVSKFLYRERVELILGQTQADNEDEQVSAKGRGLVSEHRFNIKQVIKSVLTLKKLLSELESANTGE